VQAFQPIPPDVEDVMDALSQKSFPTKCPKCDCALLVINLTFFTFGPDSKAWVLPAQLCPNCQLADTEKFIGLAEC
jgi:hypothetical protein